MGHKELNQTSRQTVTVDLDQTAPHEEQSDLGPLFVTDILNGQSEDTVVISS